jgi:hypothetical protein
MCSPGTRTVPVVLRATIVNSTEGANFALFLEFLGRRYPTARKKSKIKGGRLLPVLFTLDFALTGTTDKVKVAFSTDLDE